MKLFICALAFVFIGIGCATNNPSVEVNNKGELTSDYFIECSSGRNHFYSGYVDMPSFNFNLWEFTRVDTNELVRTNADCMLTDKTGVETND